MSFFNFLNKNPKPENPIKVALLVIVQQVKHLFLKGYQD